jgi:hypothetical protein
VGKILLLLTQIARVLLLGSKLTEGVPSDKPVRSRSYLEGLPLIIMVTSLEAPEEASERNPMTLESGE